MIIETCPKCGHELFNSIIDTYPPIYRKECYKCGWSFEKMDSIIKIPFDDSEDSLNEQR